MCRSGRDEAGLPSPDFGISGQDCLQDSQTHLIARWGSEIAEDIKPLDLQRWLKSLHTDKGLAWTTVSKIRGVMLRIYKIGILHELVSKNPAQPVETRSTTNYRA